MAMASFDCPTDLNVGMIGLIVKRALSPIMEYWGKARLTWKDLL